MFEEEVDQPAEATDESGAEGAGDDGALLDAVDQQAATSDGTDATAAPEVPDDANARISAAQQHIDNLNMDEEREAAKRAM
jgi:hypothetical protein